jgi:uncharacterized membrane protein YfcA
VTISVVDGILLLAAGLAGGFIDAIAGGGGLITVPALMAVGLPPHLALGTNKLQSICGTAVALRRYARHGLTRTPWLVLAVVCAAVAGAGGALAVSVLGRELLRQVVPVMLVAVAVYTGFNRRFGLEPGRARLSPFVFAIGGGLLLGGYDGFFGPGTGSFWMLALVGLLGLELRAATGYTKAVNLASNLGSLVVFLMFGSVHFGAAGVMIVGQLLGARLGSGLVIAKGARLIRPVFLTVVLALAVKLALDAWGG